MPNVKHQAHTFSAGVTKEQGLHCSSAALQTSYTSSLLLTATAHSPSRHNPHLTLQPPPGIRLPTHSSN